MRTAAPCSITARRRSSALSTRPAANSTASSVNPSAEPSSYPQIPRTRRKINMVISDKQQEANRQNAQHSTGPNTPEAKAAVRLNALTYGLRTRDLILPNEDSEEYKQLWADLEAEWQPQNRTERMHLEQMSTSQWLLARFAKSE